MARSKTRRAVLKLLVLTPLLAACNAILGISDFEKAECPGGGACYDETGTSSGSSGGLDAGDARADAPINVVDARGADPVSWAQKPMPNYPADGGPTLNLEKLTPGMDPETDASVVRDEISELTWRRVPDSEKNAVDWNTAKTMCPTGYRLPTRIELVTLLNLDPSRGGAVRAHPDLNLQAQDYWTTSLVRVRDPQSGNLLITTQHWAVNFKGNPASNTPLFGMEESASAAVICVKAKP